MTGLNQKLYLMYRTEKKTTTWWIRAAYTRMRVSFLMLALKYVTVVTQTIKFRFFVTIGQMLLLLQGLITFIASVVWVTSVTQDQIDFIVWRNADFLFQRQVWKIRCRKKMCRDWTTMRNRRNGHLLPVTTNTSQLRLTKMPRLTRRENP